MLHITLANILVRLWEPDGRRIPALTVDSGEEEELRLPARGHLSNGGNLDQINLYLYLCIKLLKLIMRARGYLPNSGN